MRRLLRRLRAHAAARRAGRAVPRTAARAAHVCELCTPRAAHEGWIREGLPTTPGVARAAARERRGSLLRAPARARRRARAAAAGRRPRPIERVDEPEPDARRRAAAADAPPPPGRDEPAREPRARAAPRPRDPDERRPEDRARARALQRQPSTRAPSPGVARSLGRPLVAVRPSADRGQRSSRSSSAGSCPGTATRSTSPTRRRACALAAPGRRARPSSTAEDQAPNAVADERGALAPRRSSPPE